jgi:methionyl-tRNA formyltransferase|tara:strand:+ start:182 stop:1132 length:951 start_codon:yes stop_codon:yes gene_type:complete
MNDLTGVKVGFFGTPDFALKFLIHLHENNAEISFIVTQPASVSGRGKKINFSPVEKWGKEKKIKVYSPTKVNELNFRKDIKKKKVDFIVVVAYGNLIDDFIINSPKFLTINVHSSLLPKWRGAAPIQRSILNDDKETGICVMKVEEKLDAGPIIKLEKIKINFDDNAGSIYKKMILVGRPLLVKAIKDIINDDHKMIIQKENLSTYAKKIKKSESRIKWEHNAEKINLMVRAFNPFPGAWTRISGDNKRIKILKSEVVKKKIISHRNLVIGDVSDNLEVKCGKDFLKIIELQLEGKKVLNRVEFLNGYKIKNLKLE